MDPGWSMSAASTIGEWLVTRTCRGSAPPVPAQVTDAVRLYRLVLEKGKAGARYHAVGEEGVALRDIAEVIGAGLKMPVESITPEEAPEYFGWLANLAQIDLAASGALTRQQLDWTPTGPNLLTDLSNMRPPP